MLREGEVIGNTARWGTESTEIIDVFFVSTTVLEFSDYSSSRMCRDV